MPVAPILLLLAVLWLLGALLLGAAGGMGRLRTSEIFYAPVACGFCLVSWLGMTLTQLGHFTPASFGGAVAVVVVLLIVLIARAGRARAVLDPYRSKRWWLGLLPILLILALLPALRPFEYVLGGRDPGVYVNAGVALSKSGSIPFRDPQVDELPSFAHEVVLGRYNSHGIITTERLQGFWYPSGETERLVPQGMHLLPIWIAIAQRLFGYPGLLWIIPVIACVGVLGIVQFAARFAGWGRAALAGALVLACPIQIYFSRYPNSEVLVQALIWISLFCFELAIDGESRLFAALAGASAGLTLLARIDSILILVPVAFTIIYFVFARPSKSIVLPFAGAFAAVALQAAGQLWFVSRPYALSIVNVLKIIPTLTELALPGFVILLLLALLFRERLRRVTANERLQRVIDAAAPLAVLGLCGYAYFWRPSHPGGQWDLGNANSARFFVHYVGVAAGAVLALGLAWLARSMKSRNVFFTCVIAVWFGFYFYRLQIYPELIWATRRFVPVICPAAFVVIGLVLGRLWERRLRGWGGLLAARGAAVAVVVVVAWQSWRPALFHYRLNEYAGAIGWVERVAKVVGQDDLLVFEPRFGSSLQTLSLPLWSVYGRNVFQFTFDRPQPGPTEELFEWWQQHHRGRVLLAVQKGIELATRKYASKLVYAETVSLPVLEQVYNGYPRKQVEFRIPLEIYALSGRMEAAREPAPDQIDIGDPSDSLLVSYYYLRENDGERTFRWSTYKGGVYLRDFDESVTAVEIRLTQGPRPEATVGRASCMVTLADVRLGVIWPTPTWETYRFAVPEYVRSVAQSGGAITLGVRVTPFSPAACLPGSNDARALGVAVDWIRLVRP